MSICLIVDLSSCFKTYMRIALNSTVKSSKKSCKVNLFYQAAISLGWGKFWNIEFEKVILFVLPDSRLIGLIEKVLENIKKSNVNLFYQAVTLLGQFGKKFGIYKINVYLVDKFVWLGIAVCFTQNLADGEVQMMISSLLVDTTIHKQQTKCNVSCFENLTLVEVRVDGCSGVQWILSY